MIDSPTQSVLGSPVATREEAPSAEVEDCLAQADGTVLTEGMCTYLAREGSVKKTSYSNAVRDDLDEAIKPDFVVKDGVDDVSIPEELMEDVDPRWKYFVVGYFMNDAPHIGSIHLTLNRIWSSPAGEGVEN